MDLPVQLLEARNQPLARLLVAHHDRGAVQAPRLSGQVVCRRRLGQLVDQQVVGVVPQRQRLVEDGQSKTRDLAARAAHVAGGDEREGAAQIVTHNARLLVCPSDPSAHDDPLAAAQQPPRSIGYGGKTGRCAGCGPRGRLAELMFRSGGRDAPRPEIQYPY
jgi:hypothetical protein